MEKIFEFGSTLELFLNFLEAITLLVSIITVLFFTFNKFSKGLKYILGPCGLSFWNRVSILIMCRKSVTVKRAFIEYAILKTQGYGYLPSEWRSFINEFKSFYGENQGDLVYEIHNCTLLIGTDLYAAIDRYFTYLKRPKVKRAFGIREDKIEWVLKVRISEAYATPTCLLTGLLAEYEESWEEFIKRYVSTAYMSEDDDNSNNSIISSELYLTFAWLLWGPSFEIDYKHYWAGLCQISYGDESNSIPAIADRDSEVLDQLRSKFISSGGQYGGLFTAEVSIYDKKDYYGYIREYVNPANEYFYDKIENGDIPFAVQIDKVIPTLSYKSKKYYCTAYVWLLFELEDESSFEFHPEKTVAFFEHSNLTDGNTYSFLIETLIDKSLKHFNKIFSDEKYSGRKYRFVCALNDNIEGEFKKKYTEVMNDGSAFGASLKERVFLEPKRSPATAFMAFDEFFMNKNTLEFIDVKFGDKKSINYLGQFYTDIYMSCFPDDNERETFDSILNYLKEGRNGNYVYHILLAKDDSDRIVGGGIFDYFKNTNSAVIEFLAVKEDLQSGGLGSQIYSRIKSILAYDANSFGKKTYDNIFCEIDSPKYSKASVKKYLYFWNKNNYKHLDFSYVQPALSENQEAVTGLWLTVASNTYNADGIDGTTVESVIYDYMKYCMRIKNPLENSDYQKMSAELKSKGKIKLLNIFD